MADVYFITGANRGIGRQLTTNLLSQGHTVLAGMRQIPDEDFLDLGEKYGDQLTIYKVDVTSDSSVQNLKREIANRKIDTLINNAGVLLDAKANLSTSLDMTAMESSFQANTMGPVRVTQALLPVLLKSDAPRVLNISSKMGSIADNQSGHAYAYRMSKAALNMFTKSFAIDVPQITSICIHPGWVQTDMGGKNATVSVEESAQGILKVLSSLKSSDSGQFFDYQGNKLPW